jgi:hypothetical protein
LLYGLSNALQFPFPFNNSFAPYVNGLNLYSPLLTGFGVERWTPFTTYCALWNTDYTGKALIMSLPIYGEFIEQSIRKVLNNGRALGYGNPSVIMFPSYTGIAGFVGASRDFGVDVSDIGVPAVEISVDFWGLCDKVLSTPGGVVPIIVRDDDPDPLFVLWPMYAVVTCGIIMTSFALACFAVNGYKMFLHFRWTDGVTTPKIFFIIDLFGNVMRFVYSAINPFFVNHLNYTVTVICTTTHLAISIVCTLLVALKWFELLQKSHVRAIFFLERFKWPFFIAGFLIFSVEFVSAALRGHWYNTTLLSEISWSFLIIVGFAVVVLLFISGVQILIQLHKANPDLNKKRLFQVNQTTWLLLISGVFLAFWCILHTVFMIQTFYYENWPLVPYNMTTVFEFLFLYVASLCQNWAMPLPKRSKDSHKNSNDVSHPSGDRPLEDAPIVQVSTAEQEWLRRTLTGVGAGLVNQDGGEEDGDDDGDDDDDDDDDAGGDMVSV